MDNPTIDDAIVAKVQQFYDDISSKNNNRRYDVRGTVEVGDDGYVEICLMDAAGGRQVVHLHRYPDGKKRCIGWDCWVFEDARGRQDHHLMAERKKKV